jgi:hypothetical protein
MEIEFKTKGIAVISLIEAGFSLNQCAKALGMETVKRVGILAAATRRRGNEPTPLTEEAISKLENKIGIRAGRKSRAGQGRGGDYSITLHV